MKEKRAENEQIEGLTLLLEKAGEVLKAIEKQMSDGAGFNVFRLCGVDHYETMHSKILAEFLNPRGSHGQGEFFLKSFSRTILKEKFAFNGSFTKSATVSTEISGYIKDDSIGRFDIIIEDEGRKSACIIENKIFAGEQPDQLERYSNWLKRERKDWDVILVFLTLKGREARSIKDNSQYKRLAYFSQNNDVPCLTAWIDDLCENMDKKKKSIKYALEQYKQHIINLAIGELAMEEALYEMVKNGSQRGMMAAAEMVAKYYDGIKWKLIEDLMEEVSRRLNWRPEKGEECWHCSEPGYAFYCGKDIKLWCAWNNKDDLRLFIGIGRVDGFKSKNQIQKFRKWRGDHLKHLEERKWETDKDWPLFKWIYDENGMTPTWNGQFLDKINNVKLGFREDVVSRIVKTLDDLYEIMYEFWQSL